MQRAPAERIQRVKSLAITTIFFVGCRAQQSSGIKLLFDSVLNTRGSKQRGRNGRGLHRARNATRPKAASSGKFHDQGHVHGGVVDEKSVLFFSVVTERLTVVAEQNNHCAV